MEIPQQLEQIILAILEHRQKSLDIDLSSNTHLRSDLNFDSLDLAELMIRVQNEYEKDIFADGMPDTLGDICLKIQAT